MKSELDELIEILEEEKTYLETCIKDNINELEYLHAHFHSNALFKVDRQLRILKKIKDPLYDQKLEVERMIDVHERWKELKSSLGMESYYEEKINEDKERLKKLNDQKTTPGFDEQNIDEALFHLMEKKHSGFILYLNTKSNLSFSFELLGDNMLEISLSVKSILNVDYFLATTMTKLKQAF